MGNFPTNKDQCKDGGWRAFGFKNQGQCIAFVNHLNHHNGDGDDDHHHGDGDDHHHGDGDNDHQDFHHGDFKHGNWHPGDNFFDSSFCWKSLHEVQKHDHGGWWNARLASAAHPETNGGIGGLALGAGVALFGLGMVLLVWKRRSQR